MAFEKITEDQREGEDERERARPEHVCGRGWGLVERKIKPTESSSYVTVRITDVPTDTQCGLWAEACGEPVWHPLACSVSVCEHIIICRPAACVNGDLNAPVIFKKYSFE